MLTYGRRIPLTELDYRISQVDAKTVRTVCSQYLYDKCPAIVGIGEQHYNYSFPGLVWFYLMLTCPFNNNYYYTVILLSGCGVLSSFGSSY